ncbi:MAG: PASTA domain-containing protein [Endomicrobiia bacterium]|nr:PASTA domain-containing protein [Endomicrobiaceae bacterium]
MNKLFLFLLKIGLILTIILVTTYYSFNAVMSAFVQEKAEILVPDLQGKTLVECLEVLSQSKLALIKEGSEFNQDLPAGVVIRQVPPPGINVKEGKTIRITTSQGGEIVYVPNLVGETIRATNISLRSTGLILGELTKKASVKYEEGFVISQDPVAGSTVEKDTAVNVLVSNGPMTDGTLLMIDWIGKDANDAKKWAVDENYEVDVISQTTTSANPGQVFDQYPKPDEQIDKTTKIIFYVADDNSSLALDEKQFNYTIPDKGDSKRVRFVLSDDKGEKDIFNGVKKPGSKISIPVKVQGKATVKVFFNNVSIEEVEL